MLYKPDWESAQQRFIAWWHGEVLDRPALQVTAPRQGYIPRYPTPPQSLEGQWTNADWLLERAEEHFRATFYGGEAFPCFWVNLGPDVFAAFLGARFLFRPDTSWVMPCILSWDHPFSWKIDPENRWWRLALQITETAVEVGKGKFFVGITDLHGGGDLLAALRGREAFCLDLVDHPQEVREAMQAITPLWFEVYEAFYQRIQKGMTGSSTWLNVWSPKRWYPVSMDELALISPEMFQDFFLEDLLAQIRWLDHSLFHLDGPSCLPHLDLLLSIPELNGIQWVPGARFSSMLEWIPLLKRIQKAGKLIHLTVSPQEVLPLLEELCPKGLMLATHCSSEEEARSLLKAVSQIDRR